jgi:hypothetical protein
MQGVYYLQSGNFHSAKYLRRAAEKDEKPERSSVEEEMNAVGNMYLRSLI